MRDIPGPLAGIFTDRMLESEQKIDAVREAEMWNERL